jgi:hypothetical protein
LHHNFSSSSCHYHVHSNKHGFIIHPSATEEERCQEIDPLLLFSFKKWFLSIVPGRSKSYGCDATDVIPLEEKPGPYCEPLEADLTVHSDEIKPVRKV